MLGSGDAYSIKAIKELIRRVLDKGPSAGKLRYTTGIRTLPCAIYSRMRMRRGKFVGSEKWKSLIC